MPRKKHSELTAGLFVVVGVVLVLGVVLWLGAADLLRTRGQLVSFYVPMSAGSIGIIKGAEVTLGDGRIGRIVEVHADPANARCLYRARLERSDIKIKRDAKAMVVSAMVGQAKVVLVSIGTAAETADEAHPVRLSGGLDQAMQHVSTLAENLKAASSRLRFELDPNQVASLLAKVHGIALEITAAARSVKGVAGNLQAETSRDDPNGLVGKLHKSAGDVNTATGRLAHQRDPNGKDTVVARVRRAAGNIETETDPNAEGSLVATARGTMSEIHGMVKDGRPKVDRTLASVAAAAEKIEAYTKKDIGEILANLRESNTKILKILSDFAVVSEQAKEIVTLNRDNIDETIDNLAQVSVNLKSAAKEIRRNPWRLLYEPDKKELRSQNLYDAVRAFVDGASQLDQSLAKLRLLRKIPSDDPAYQEAVQKVHKRLLESFGKFTKAEEALWKELQK